MTGEAHVMLYLEEPERVGDDQRILLRLDRSALERLIVVIDIDRDGIGAQRAKRIDEEFALGRPDLEASEVVEAANGLVGASNMAQAVLEAAARHHVDA